MDKYIAVFSLFLETFIAELLFMPSFKMRKKGFLRLVIAIILTVAINISISTGIILNSNWISSLCFLAVYLSTVVANYIIFDMPLKNTLFICIAGVSLQHLSYCVHSIMAKGIPEIHWGSANYLYYFLSLSAVMALVYSVVYFSIARFMRGNMKERISNTKIYLLSAVVLLVSLIISLFSEEGQMSLRTYSLFKLGSALICFLALVIQSGSLDNSRLEREKNIINRLKVQTEEQYKFTQNNMELINMRCHDLKHILSLLKQEENTDLIKKYESLIALYDSNIVTGNSALDVILSEKSLYCKKNNIEFNCIADGKLLSYIDDIDICCLFGNAFDNAIESVMKIEDSEKRIINLKIKKVKSTILINIQNYYSEILLDPKGELVTTKKDKDLHGYGMKSISLIAEKYGGSCNIITENSIFKLIIHFPVD